MTSQFGGASVATQHGAEFLGSLGWPQMPQSGGGGVVDEGFAWRASNGM